MLSLLANQPAFLRHATSQLRLQRLAVRLNIPSGSIANETAHTIVGTSISRSAPKGEQL